MVTLIPEMVTLISLSHTHTYTHIHKCGHENGKNMSPQKNYKLKPIVITLETTF